MDIFDFENDIVLSVLWDMATVHPGLCCSHRSHILMDRYNVCFHISILQRDKVHLHISTESPIRGWIVIMFVRFARDGIGVEICRLL